MKLDVKKYLVRQGKDLKLGDFATSYAGELKKEQGVLLLKAIKKKLNVSQQKLYASATQSLLVIFQAMDTAGKDSAIEHVFSESTLKAARCTILRHLHRRNMSMIFYGDITWHFRSREDRYP